MIKDINIDIPVDCENLPEPDDLDLTEFEEVEAKLQQDDEEAGASTQDVPTGAALRRALLARFEQDGVPSSEAQQVVAFLADVKGQWNAWSSNDEIQKRAGDEWARIKKEWDERETKLQDDLASRGAERANFGTFPHGNPLASLVLHVLLFPHRRLNPKLAFFDKTIPTFRALDQYGLWSTLKDGIASAFDTHPHQDHGSATSDPTFPSEGIFKCDAAIHELGLWMTREIYQTRKVLRCPGIALIYGDANIALFEKMRHEDEENKVTSIRRYVAVPEDPNLRRLLTVNTVQDRHTGQMFHLEYSVPDPSRPAYLAQAGEAQIGGTFALTIDRSLEEVLLAIRRPLSLNTRSFFARQARAMLQGAGDDGRPLALAVARLLAEEVQYRQVLEAEQGDDVAQSWQGFTAEEVKAKGGWIFEAIEKWSTDYVEARPELEGAIPHFSKIPGPTTLLGRARWAIVWRNVLLQRGAARPSSSNDRLPSTTLPPLSGSTLATSPQESRALPFAVSEDWPLVFNTPSLLPLSQPRQSGPVLAQPHLASRPCMTSCGSPFAFNTPSGITLAASGNTPQFRRTHSADEARPLAAGADLDSPMAFNTPSAMPLAVDSSVTSPDEDDES